MNTILPRFSVKQPVLINLLMIGIFLGGAISIFDMPQELNPDISFNWVFVTILYPGASPQEVEDLVTIPVEKELDKIDQVTELLTTAGEGYAFFLVKFDEMSSSDFTTKMQEVRIQIDNASIPDETEDPIIDDFGSDDFIPVTSVSMTTTGELATAELLFEDFVDDIERIRDVAKVQISGLEDKEIWVEVDPVKLNGYHLSLGSVVQALHQRNVNFPGGNITIGRSEFQIRALSRFESIAEIEQLVLDTNQAGDIVHLFDVARINEVRGEESIISRLDGKPAMIVSVSKSSGGSTFAVVDAVKALMARYQAEAPAEIEFKITIDSTRQINRILSVLRNNALIGITFIFIILLIFLGRANAALATLGIPLSFFITFILMHATGHSINGTSVFALIIVLGIIVDDAIIVLENVHSHRQRGKSLSQAVIDGTAEVLGPITTGILTTIAAFLPLMLLPGIMGKFMRMIPIVVSLALLASLFEALIILPSHINDWTRGSKHYHKPESKFLIGLRARYKVTVRKFLKHRYLVLTGMILILFASVALINLVGIEMFGDEDLDYFTTLIKLPEGTSLEETDRIIAKIETKAMNLPAEELAYIASSSGLYQGNSDWITRKNVGQVVVGLVSEDQRDRSFDEIIASLRDSLVTISGISSLKFERPTSGPPTAQPISIRLTGKYFHELDGAINDLTDLLTGIEGVFDIRNDLPGGKQEIRIAINEERAALCGLTSREIALELRTAVAGVTATTFRDGDEDIDVIVKLREESNNSLAEVRSLRINTRSGATIPLSDIADISVHEATTEIKRRNLKRTVIIGADIDKSLISVNEVVGILESHYEAISNRYDEVKIETGGEFEEFNTVFKDLSQLFLIGVIIMYLILGTQFRSYIQPMIILCTVPFAFIGAMIGLLVFGDKFSLVTMFGIVALAGIVVNDAIVLISFINDARRRGVERWESIVAGGLQRLRPILLTSVTTIGGLLPTVLGIGGTSEVWRPLANTIVFGLIASTWLTLLVIPCVVAIVDDIKTKRGIPLVDVEANG